MALENKAQLSTVLLAVSILLSGVSVAEPPGTGSLSIADDTYALAVSYCSQLGFEGTIAANAKASHADGRPMVNVNLTASDMNGRKEHYVDIAFTDSTHYAARLVNAGGGWQHADPYRRDPPSTAPKSAAGPLVTVTGTKVRVGGLFYDPAGNPLAGTIEIHCPR